MKQTIITVSPIDLAPRAGFAIALSTSKHIVAHLH